MLATVCVSRYYRRPPLNSASCSVPLIFPPRPPPFGANKELLDAVMANFATMLCLLTCHLLRTDEGTLVLSEAAIAEYESAVRDSRPARKVVPLGPRVPAATIVQMRKAMASLQTDPALAAELAGALAANSEGLPDRVFATVLWIQGSGLAISEKYRQALDILTQAETLARKINDDKLLRRVLRYKSAAAYECAEFVSGRDAAIEAIRLSEVLKDETVYVATLHSDLAINESALGNKEAAIEHLISAVEISDRSGDKTSLSKWLVNAGGLMSELGQHQQAIDSFQRVLKLEGSETENLVVVAAHGGLGEVLVDEGRLSDAEIHLQSALVLCEQPGAESIRGNVEASLGRLFAARNNGPQAEHHFKKSLAVFQQLKNPSGVAMAEQALRNLSDSATPEQDIVAIRRDLEQAEGAKNLELQIALHKELSGKLGDAELWRESSIHARRAAVLEQQLASTKFTGRIAGLLAEVSHLEKQQVIQDLQSEVSLGEKLIIAQRRWNMGLVVCLGMMLAVLVMIIVLLQSKRRAVRELRLAQSNLREQKIVQVKMERRLAEQQKTQSLALMASGIAHDFNNLLAGIAGLAELAVVSSAVDRKNELLQQITETSLQASGLTGQLLQFLGKPGKEPVQCDVADVIESTIGLLQSVARPNVLSLEGRAGPCHAEIDETRLRQVLVNLVSNAAEASGAESRILLSIDSLDLSKSEMQRMNSDAELQSGEYCRIRVVDSGHGISAETRARLFDPYFSTKAIGRGLGLSSVIGIVRSCRGFVYVESEPERGCCFSVFLKSVKCQVECCAAAENDFVNHDEVTLNSSPRILVVDDEPALLDMQNEYLTISGFRVSTARSAEEAFRLAVEQEMEFDCVVTDFCMDGKDGKWLAAQLRSLVPDLPVIMCSGFSDGAIQPGEEVTKVLSKPYSPKTLVSLIRECIGTQNSEGTAEYATSLGQSDADSASGV